MPSFYERDFSSNFEYIIYQLLCCFNVFLNKITRHVFLTHKEAGDLNNHLDEGARVRYLNSIDTMWEINLSLIRPLVYETVRD